MSGNIKPSIPDTDDGIWGRMKLVPWLRTSKSPKTRIATASPTGTHPAPGRRKTRTGDKIKATELPGVFLRLVQGLVDYLEHGFVEPDSVTAGDPSLSRTATRWQRFLSLCTEAEPESRVKSSELHDVLQHGARPSAKRNGRRRAFPTR
jgi:putative DNA primase/helicase